MCDPINPGGADDLPSQSRADISRTCQGVGPMTARRTRPTPWLGKRSLLGRPLRPLLVVVHGTWMLGASARRFLTATSTPAWGGAHRSHGPSRGDAVPGDASARRQSRTL